MDLPEAALAETHSSTSDKPSGARIKDVLHDGLIEAGITIKHRPRTNNQNEVDGGFATRVVTRYVEHAFVTWLLYTKHRVSPDPMPITTHCLAPSVDPEIFFETSEFDDVNDEDNGDAILLADHEYVAQVMEDAEMRRGQAKQICDGCPFSLNCLTRSIVTESKPGIWGGLDARERHLMINRFQAMRREYTNKSMPVEMRKDFESYASQVAHRIAHEARMEDRSVPFE